MPIIIPTTSAEYLGQKLSEKNDVRVIFPDKNKDGQRLFPDGEIYVKIPQANDIDGRTIVLHSGAPNPNKGLVELKLILEILKTSKAKPIEVFFAYFPYGMQDNIWQAGETNAAENLIKELIDYYNVEKIYTIDAHFSGREWVQKYPIENISAVDLLIQAAKNDYAEIICMAPDTGGQIRTGLAGTKKKRKNSFTTEIHCDDDFKNAVSGKVVAAVDDLLETGGTMERFYDECLKCGAKDVIALITHGVLQKGIDRIINKYSKLYLTNTIDRAEANIEVTDLICNSISK